MIQNVSFQKNYLEAQLLKWRTMCIIECNSSLKKCTVSNGDFFLGWKLCGESFAIRIIFSKPMLIEGR